MIKLNGVDLVEFVKAVYDLSRPAGMGFLHFEPGGLTDEEAKALVNIDSRYPISLDYVKGRGCKMCVWRTKDGDFEIANRWFDHSIEDLQALLDRFGVTVPVGTLESGI